MFVRAWFDRAEYTSLLTAFKQLESLITLDALGWLLDQIFLGTFLKNNNFFRAVAKLGKNIIGNLWIFRSENCNWDQKEKKIYFILMNIFFITKKSKNES